MKTVLITGASGGIGKALVSRFTRAGWKVIACDRSGDGLRVDVTDENSIRAARQTVGVPDVLINNAGIGLLGPIAELPDEIFAKQFDVNVRGIARMVRAFAPGMCERGQGRIVNVSSLAGVTSLPWFGAYAASKHAVEAVSDAMRLELAPFGVKVAIVEPSIVHPTPSPQGALVGTGFVDAAIESLEKSAPNSRWETALRNTVARRDSFLPITVTPERVAEAVFHAATARFPRTRYRVGWLASLLIRGQAFLPTFLTDAIMRAMVGLTRPKTQNALPSTSLETR
ncbi:MAG: SDR family oxidoreductase [Archangium sp.]|nr:SDR family oxidoreductase [Archangium sp.]